MRLLVALTMLGAATLMVMLAPPMAETASAVELLDAELVAAGSPVLENASGTVRLEQGRLGSPASSLYSARESAG
jgi:hypothetical protein